ncbi:aldolase/citrate lyase family protein [Nocardioides zeae]
MRSAKDFFAPLAVGAPAPVREVPARPSRAIHFFDPSNPKMAAKVPAMVGTVDVLLGNLEDAVKADKKVEAREGLVRIGQEVDFGPTQLWTRINALDSPWALDDLTTLVPTIGHKLDVVMVPKVQGAEDIHYVDRLLAQLEAKAGLDRPILVHAILETARGVANVEEICGASPRMQGLSLGPADLAADRRMKTTRVGGGHPGYLVRQDPPKGRTAPRRSRRSARRTSRTCGTTPSPGWSTRAQPTGSTPTTGPSATSPTSSPARTSSATPSCSAAWARGRCTPVRSRSPTGSSPPASRTSGTRAASSPRWVTAPAPSCSTARWRTTPPSSSAS